VTVTAPDGAVVPRTGAAYFEEFRGADDLFEFAQRMRAAAAQGDAAAMYLIYQIYKRCDSEYSLSFENDDGAAGLTLDQAVAREVERPIIGGADEVRRLHAQCRRWRSEPRESREQRNEMMERSADAGYPPAQAAWASHLLHHRGNHDNPTREERARARELTIAALASRDPEAYLDAATNIPHLTDFSGDDALRFKAWFYAACLRGVDCGPQSGFVKRHCARDPSCQPYESLLDILHRGPDANQADEIERRAREISDLIDAGRWDDLGFAR